MRNYEYDAIWSVDHYYNLVKNIDDEILTNHSQPASTSEQMETNASEVDNNTTTLNVHNQTEQQNISMSEPSTLIHNNSIK